MWQGQEDLASIEKKTVVVVAIVAVGEVGDSCVRFVVKSKGETRYDKQVRQDAKWDSSFVGAIAIPDAINHYSEQFRLILLRLYRDPEFLKALRPAAKVATSGDATREAAPAT